MRLRFLFCLALLLHLPASVEAAEPGKITVAVVNLNLACNQIGFDLVSLDSDTKKTLAKIRSEKAKLQAELLGATDEIALRKINETLQFLNSKEQAIRSSLGQMRSGNDYNKFLGQFIKERFGKKYPIILIAGSGDWTRHAVQFEVQEVDITAQVVEEFKKDLEMK